MVATRKKRLLSKRSLAANPAQRGGDLGKHVKRFALGCSSLDRLLGVGLVLIWFGLETVGAQVPNDSSLSKAGANATSKEVSLQLADLQAQVQKLQESLALANAEAETFRQQWQDLRLRNQAMGVDALTGDEKKLEARLVEAVKELYQTEQERRSAVDRLQQLLDAGKQLLKNASIDPKRRAEYEVAVRAAKEFLDTRPNTTTSSPVDLTQGRVEHVNGELNTVIVNLGSDLGVKPGMPFRVVRGEEIIGRVKAFEVRETVCAAVVESVENGKELKIGDQVSVAAEK